MIFKKEKLGNFEIKLMEILKAIKKTFGKCPI